jgi:hypothetical protein
VDVNKAWETIRENIKISVKESLGYCELKKNKLWFDEGRTKLLDERKHAILQYLQVPSEINGNNLNNIRREISRHFRDKERQYLKGKIDELATSQERGSPGTQMPLTSGLEECSPKYRTERSEL